MITQINMHDLTSDMSFIFYVILILGCYFMAAGAISVQASYVFVKNIYTSIRKD